MLQRLGRWLRAAGYDTIIENNSRSDYELLCQAINEQRFLITCDRKMLQYRRAPGTVILLSDNSLEKCIDVLSRQLPVNWCFQPFIRCTVCNTRLQPATHLQQVRAVDRIFTDNDLTCYCPVCEQVYWEESHARRMREQLELWDSLYPA